MKAWTKASHAVQIGLDVQGFFARQRTRHGSTFFVQMPGLERVLFTSEPKHVAELFQLSGDVVSSSLPSPIQPLLGDGSLILLQGNAHGAERLRLKPAFQGRCLLQYDRFMRDAIEAACPRGSATVVAQSWMQDVTLDVIVRAIFGQEGQADRLAFAAACKRLIASYSALLLLLPGVRVRAWGMGPWDRFLRAREALDRQIRYALERAIERQGDDVIGRLASSGAETDLRDPDVWRAWRDRLTTMILAGYETTANTLAWALYYLTRHPEQQDRMALSLGDGETSDDPVRQAMRHPELDAFCKEVMRLHPVVPLVIRSVLSPVDWAGHQLRPGEYAGIATLNVHSDPAIYADPSRFDPLRFVGRKATPHEYVPFGGGDKKCLGNGFAVHEMKIVLATILTRYRVALAAPVSPRMRIQGLALTPKPGIRLQLTPRS